MNDRNRLRKLGWLNQCPGRWWFGPAVFGLLTLAMFADVPFRGRGMIVSAASTDLVQHFVASRAFGFGELARGNLPLWSPRMFAGYPYFGGFQPALLYPLNWHFLVLPLDWAINLGIALHAFLAGFFTFLWLAHGCDAPKGDDNATHRRVGAVFGGIVFMFCGRFFLHVYAGHVPHVCLMPWVPVLLLAVDRLARDGRLAWGLPGACALAMMVLAGYPQMVYFTAIAMPVYAGWRLVESKHRLRTVAGMVLVGLLGTGLCAVQILAGRDAAAESVRSAGTSYNFSASFSFPPENLLTLVAPGVLGPVAPPAAADAPAYVGQAYLWEVSTYVGSAALVLAIVGAIGGGRNARLPVAMVFLTAILGLGANTPLHRMLYDWLPGFAAFRGSSKFLFLTSLFIASLSATGVRTLLGRSAVRLWPALVAGGLACLLALLALAIYSGKDANGWFAGFLRHVAERATARGDAYLDIRRLGETAFIARAAGEATVSLLIAAGVLSAVGVALAISIRRPVFVLLPPLIGVIELFTFARSHREVSPMLTPPPEVWRSALVGLKPGERYIRQPPSYEYRGPGDGSLDAWGYDPGVLRRYAELMYFANGFDPDGASSNPVLRPPVPASVFAAARITQVLAVGPESRPMALALPVPALPRAILVPAARVIRDRDELLSTFCQPGFDPSYTVLLETEPKVRIAGRTPTPVDVIDIDTDTREVRVNVVAPSVLLLTDAFSRHWHVEPISQPASQPGYEIQPGDWALTALPLSTGEHHFRLVYRPMGYVVGGWVSLASVLGLIAWSTGVWLAGFRRRGRPSSPLA